MKKLVSFFAFLLLAVPAFAATEAAKEKPYKEINLEELQSLIKSDKPPVIIDARGGKWFDGTVIEGAKQLATDQTTADALAKIAPQKDATIVFYCTDINCPASSLSAYKAAAAGYTSILKYPGGIKEWQEKGLPTAKVN